jgi:hypothetical protein
MVFSSLASKLVAAVSPDLASKPAVGFLVEPQNQGGGRFSLVWPQNRQLWFGDLGLKITATVFCFGIKTKQASVCRLRHKTNGGSLAWDTCRDLAACLAWKQVWLGFPSLD